MSIFLHFLHGTTKKHVKRSHLIPLLGPGDFSLLTHMLRWWMVHETKRIRARVRVCMMYRTTFFSFNRMMVIGCSVLPIPCFCCLRYVSFWVCTGCSCSNYKSSLVCFGFDPHFETRIIKWKSERISGTEELFWIELEIHTHTKY